MNSHFTIAVHSLVLLASQPRRMATSETIAKNVATHPARIRKVMSCLRKNGYVNTKEGTHGGFILCHDPQDISLASIYKLTSPGALQPKWCSGKTADECPISANMGFVMNHVWNNAEQHLEHYFETISIYDVLQHVQHTSEHTGASDRQQPFADCLGAFL